MITAIVEAFKQISSDLILDIGFILIMTTGLYALVYLTIIKGLAYRKQIAQLSHKIVAAQKDKATCLQTIDKQIVLSGLKEIKLIWVRNLCQSPNNLSMSGWRGKGPSELVNQAIMIRGRRQQIELIPGIILSLAIFASALSVLAEVEASQQTQSILAVWAAVWPIILFLNLAALFLAALVMLADQIVLSGQKRALVRLFSNLTDNLQPVSEQTWLQAQLAEQQIQTEVLSSLGEQLSSQVLSVLDHRIIPDLRNSYQQSMQTYLLPAVQTLQQTMAEFDQQVLVMQEKGMQQLADSFSRQVSEQFSEQLAHLKDLAVELDQLQQVQTERLSASGQQSSEYLTQMQQTLSDSLATLSKVATDQYLTVQQQSVERFQQLLDNVEKSTQTQQIINQYTEATLGSIIESKTQLAQTTEVLQQGLAKTNNLAEIMGQLLETDQQLLHSLGDERQAMQTINDGYFTRMGLQINQLQDDLNSEIESIFGRFTDVYTTTYEHVDEQTGTMIQGFEERTHAVLETMDEQIRDITFLSRELTAEIGTLNQQLELSVARFSNQLSDKLVEQATDMDNHVRDLTDRLVQTTEMIRDAVDDLPAAVLLTRAHLTSNGMPDIQIPSQTSKSAMKQETVLQEESLNG